MGQLDKASFEKLRQRHADLENRIHREYTRRRPDDMALKQMKLEKLYVKEQLDRLSVS